MCFKTHREMNQKKHELKEEMSCKQHIHFLFSHNFSMIKPYNIPWSQCWKTMGRKSLWKQEL